MVKYIQSIQKILNLVIGKTDLPKNLIFLSASFKTYKSNKKQIEENIHKLKAEKENLTTIKS